MKNKTKNNIKKIELRGALRLESKTIRILLIISIFAFSISVILEYIFPLIDVVKSFNCDYIINVLLGVTCSAIISLICIWIPFLSKEEAQRKRLSLAAKELFYDYISLRTTIISYTDIPTETYLGELSLIKNAEKLKEGAERIIYEYNNSDIHSECLQKIIDNINSVFIPMVEITLNFTKIILPKNHSTIDNLIIIKKEYFDAEETVALYNELVSSIDQIMSYEDIVQLFSNYIDLNNFRLDIFKNSTNNLLESTQIYCTQRKNSTIQLSLINNMQKIMFEFSNKHIERKVDVLKRIKLLNKKINSLPEKLKKEYSDRISKIHEHLHNNQLDIAEQEVSKLQKELQTAHVDT